MLTATKDLMLPTTVTGSWPRPRWYTGNLLERPYSTGLGDVDFREQHLDAVATVISDQELAGLDILTNGDYHLDFDLAGRSWFSYPSERLSGISEFDTETTAGWEYPVGTWLNEIVGGWKYHAIVDKVGPRVPLEFAKVWRVAQSRTEKPVKFGTIAADLASTVLTVKTDVYDDDKRELMWDIATVLNAELRQLVAAGCKIVQIEEPAIHSAAAWGADEETLEFYVDLFNYTVEGLEAEIWVHTCWGNPGAQHCFQPTITYEASLEIFLERVNADVWTIESKHNGHQLLPRFGPYKGSSTRRSPWRSSATVRSRSRRWTRSRPTFVWRSSTSTPSTSSSRRTAGSGDRAYRGRSRSTRLQRSRRAPTSSVRSWASRRPRSVPPTQPYRST